MTSLEKTIDILSACLTPTVAVIGIIIAIIQCRLAFKKRKDDLFDRRYAFYKQIERYWLETSDIATGREPELEGLVSAAQEAEFLFGNDVRDHILSLEGKRHDGSPYFPNEDFVKPFRKYLELR